MEHKVGRGSGWRRSLAEGRGDVPAYFDYEWVGGRREIPNYCSNAGYDFMVVWCGSDSNFGRLDDYHNNYISKFIRQFQ